MRNAIYGLTATTIAAAAILTSAPAYAQFTPLSIDLNQSYYLNMDAASRASPSPTRRSLT